MQSEVFAPHCELWPKIPTMDQRQAQIRERAGLEEARLNEEFIDFLRKYGWLLLLLMGLAFGATAARRYYKEYNVKKIDSAFVDLEGTLSSGNVSPNALLAVASDHSDIRAVPDIAKLEAADAYLSAVRRGIKPGAKVEPDGSVASSDDLITDADRETFLGSAQSLYQEIYDRNHTNLNRKVMTLGTIFGLAAVAESRRDLDKAKGYYEQIITLTDKTTFSGQGLVAKQRIDRLPGLASLPKLLPRTELPEIAAEDKPVLPTGGETVLPGLNLTPAEIPTGGTPSSDNPPLMFIPKQGTPPTPITAPVPVAPASDMPAPAPTTEPSPTTDPAPTPATPPTTPTPTPTPTPSAPPSSPPPEPK